MSRNIKCSALLPKIRRLLKANQTKEAIKKKLCLTRYKFDKLMEQLSLSYMRCRKRISKLSPYRGMIEKWIVNGYDIKKIQKKLAAMQQCVHYTTVRNYIRSLNKAEPEPSFSKSRPGEVAYVSVLQIKQSKESYLFCFLLGYSHFSYFSVLSKPELSCFFQCHADCFKQLGGVPGCIQFCEVSCLRLSNKDLIAYKSFLAYYGSSKGRNIRPAAERELCIHHSERARKDILSTFFHSDVKRLASALKNKHANLFNTELHPVTKRPIIYEFKQVEKQALLCLPSLPYKIFFTEDRKVSVKAKVCYANRKYQLPMEYAGQTVQLTSDNKQVMICCRKKIIATYSLHKSKQKK